MTSTDGVLGTYKVEPGRLQQFDDFVRLLPVRDQGRDLGPVNLVVPPDLVADLKGPS